MATNSGNNAALAAQRRQNPVREGLDRTGLYHSFRLPNGQILQGSIDLTHMEERLASFRLPQDLTGKDVLDIGPWDGYFTFELERRGANVTAIDYVDLDTFRALQRVFASRAQYKRMDVYELSPSNPGTFDIVLCLGVLYHLKHPLLALEKICAVTRDICIIDSFVVDGERWLRGERPALPYLEFYETDEFGGQLDNWCGPTVSAVEALARAAGFAQTEVLAVTDSTARIAAYRQWRHLLEDSKPPVVLVSVNCHSHRGRCFRTEKEEYFALWCAWDGPPAPNLADVFPEVDGFGVAPIACSIAPDGLLVSVRVPPGLAPGRHEVRLKIAGHMWSSPQAFYVDLPLLDHPIRLLAVQDGITWENNVADWGNGGWLTLWLDGLSMEGDPGNTTVHIDGVPHLPDAVCPAQGQVNVRLRPVVQAGSHDVTVFHRGAQSNTERLLVKGPPPPVRGLERLTM